MPDFSFTKWLPAKKVTDLTPAELSNAVEFTYNRWYGGRVQGVAYDAETGQELKSWGFSSLFSTATEANVQSVMNGIKEFVKNSSKPIILWWTSLPNQIHRLEAELNKLTLQSKTWILESYSETRKYYREASSAEVQPTITPEAEATAMQTKPSPGAGQGGAGA